MVSACWIYAVYWRYIASCFPIEIVNIHPSLLPSFPGKDAIGQAFAHGVKVTGVTVHFVDDGMDTGTDIIATSCRSCGWRS